MFESLEAMVERVSGFERDSVPDESLFGYPPGLARKVDPVTGSFRGFFGATVIAMVPREQGCWIAELCTDLHREMGRVLAQPLRPETMHMTICDLWSSADAEGVSGHIMRALPEAVHLTTRARGCGALRFRVQAVFNLMNTSVAIGLVPSGQEDHRRMMGAREIYGRLVDLPPFTPHITLAYYRGGDDRGVDPVALRAWLRTASRAVEGRDVVLHGQDIRLALFTDMNSYHLLDPGGAPQVQALRSGPWGPEGS